MSKDNALVSSNERGEWPAEAIDLIGRQRAEIERLTAACEHHIDTIRKTCEKVDRLTAALQQILAIPAVSLPSFNERNIDRSYISWARMRDVARQALAGEPAHETKEVLECPNCGFNVIATSAEFTSDASR